MSMEREHEEHHFVLKRQGLALALIALILFVSGGGSGAPTVIASGTARAQTAAIPSLASINNTSGDHVFSIGGDLDVTTLTLGTVTLRVAWTDWNGGAQTFTMATGNGVGPLPSNTLTLMSKASTNVTIQTTTAAFVGTYNVAGYIMLMR